MNQIQHKNKPKNISKGKLSIKMKIKYDVEISQQRQFTITTSLYYRKIIMQLYTWQQIYCQSKVFVLFKIYYESYQLNLWSQIKARNKEKQEFREVQVWYILYCCVNALRQFQAFSEPSGNISAQDILMNVKGQVKLNLFLSSPYQPARSSIFSNYFAPEELQIMKQTYHHEGNITRLMYKQFNINPNICQVYSLGIILLMLTTGCNYLNLYAPPFEINQRNITIQLKKLSSLGYSKVLTNLIKIMLTDYKNRPLSSQIRQIFKQFQYQILNFKQFSLTCASSEVQSVF